MGQQEYMRSIRRIEAEFPVERWTIDGLAVWPLLRIHGLFASPSSFAQPTRRHRLRRLLDTVRRDSCTALSILASTSSRHAAPPAPVAALLFGDGVSYLRPEPGAAWHDRFCDPLRVQLDRLGRSHAMLVPGPARYPLARPAWPIHLHLRYALLRGPAGRQHTDMPGFDEVAAILQQEVGWRPTMPWLVRHVRRIRCYARWYGRQLDRLRPRVVFLVSYYCDEGFALLLASHRRRIPTVDIQHGVQGEIHPAYAAFARMPANGWELLPSRFWVWSTEEAQAISAWGGSRHVADVVGNALLDDCLAELVRSPGPDGSNLLISLQYGFDTDAYYRILNHVIEALPSSMTVSIRLHPVQLPGLRRIAARFPCRCDVDRPSRSPLYQVLSQASVHLTHSSSTVIEASALGIPSVVFDPLGAALYHKQIADGSAVLATTPEQISAHIIHLASSPRRASDAPGVALRRSTLIKRLDELTRPIGCNPA